MAYPNHLKILLGFLAFSSGCAAEICFAQTPQASSESKISVRKLFSKSLDMGIGARPGSVFNRDGTLLAYQDVNKIRILEIPAGKEKLAITRSKGCNLIAFADDGKHLLAAYPRGTKDQFATYYDQTLTRYAITTGREEQTMELKGIFRAIFPGQRQMLVWKEGLMSVIDTQKGEIINEIRVTQNKRSPGYAILSPNGKKVAIASGTKSAKVWSTDSGKELFDLEGSVVSFGASGKWIATAGPVRIWHAETGKYSHDVKLPPRMSALDVNFSPDEKWLAVGAIGKTRSIYLFDPISGRLLSESVAAPSGSESVCFSPQGNVLVSGGNAVLEVWEITSQKGESPAEKKPGESMTAVGPKA